MLPLCSNSLQLLGSYGLKIVRVMREFNLSFGMAQKARNKDLIRNQLEIFLHERQSISPVYTLLFAAKSFGACRFPSMSAAQLGSIL